MSAPARTIALGEPGPSHTFDSAFRVAVEVRDAFDAVVSFTFDNIPVQVGPSTSASEAFAAYQATAQTRDAVGPRHLKVFHESYAFLGPAVIEAIGDERHHQQSNLFVVAATKKAAVEALMTTGMPEHVAVAHGRALRVMKSPYSTDLRAAVEGGVIDPGVEGIYAFSVNRGPRLVRLTADGPVAVATRHYDPETHTTTYLPAEANERTSL